MTIVDDVKLAWNLFSQYKKIKELIMNNNGITSSGFIMTVLGLIVTVLMAFWGQIPVNVLALAVVILPSVYTIARAIIKATASKTDDETFNKILDAIKPVTDKLNIPTEKL